MPDGCSQGVLLIPDLAGRIRFMGSTVNAGVKLHHAPEQECTTLIDLAGAKLHHLG